VEERLFELRQRPEVVEWQMEPIGVVWSNSTVAQLPLDQLMWAGYDTSWVEYGVNVTVTAEMVKQGEVTLTVSQANDYLYIWMDDSFIASHPTPHLQHLLHCLHLHTQCRPSHSHLHHLYDGHRQLHPRLIQA